jgi:hypothetical protein
MAIIVVGGNARKVGKTSVISGLISHLIEYNWMAFKITPHAHCGDDLQIVEEKSRDRNTDTSRFLVAGAKKAFLVCVPVEGMEAAMPDIRKELDKARNAIIESNSILEFIKPDIYLSILDPAVADFKSPAQQWLGQADAVLIKLGVARPVPHWRLREGSLQFIITPPSYVTPEVVNFVKSRLT